ncbi:polysaccharide biosynthesis/export family protein [Amorphus sp. MBR-141]
MRPSAASGSGVPSSSDSTNAFGKTEYRVSPQDVIEVSVFQVPDLTRTVEVDSKGAIDLPLIGTVQAGGQTPEELENDIETKLSQSYLQSPQVSVLVKEYNSQKVTVDGAVGKPGVYEVPGGASLLRVLAMAGGVDRVADRGNVKVFRNQDGRRLSAAFDIEAIRDGKALDPMVRGGDTIVVAESDSKVAWRNVRESLGVAGFVAGLVP